jgi:T5SS/PEP-CTERM-associated repeat protein
MLKTLEVCAMKCRQTSALLLAALVSWLVAAPAVAAVTNWNISSSGIFNNAANWTNGIPDADDTVAFARGAAATYTVTFPGALPIEPPAVFQSNLVLIDSNNVTFAQSPIIVRGPATYAIGTQLLVADFFQDAVLTTTLATLSTPFAAIGFAPTANGTLNVNGGTFSVTGPGSPDEALLIGNSGTGTLNVSGLGRMNLTHADGEMVIAKNNGSVGRLNITTGGQATGFFTDIGLGAGSMGFVTVDGPGSRWSNSETLNVGRSGVGTLTVSGGGHVVDRDVSLGAANGGQGIANIMDSGSLWTQSADLRVGVNLGTSNGVPQFGFGTLNITSGGRVDTAGSAAISGMISKATVEGTGSVWNVGGELSLDSAAELEIKPGAVVNSTTAFVGLLDDGIATVNGSGASWSIAETLSVGRTDTGTLNVTGGGHLTSRLAFLGVRGAIFSQGSAAVQIDGIGSDWTCTEQLFVGHEADAVLTISGGAHVTSGTGQVGFAAPGNGRVRVIGAGSRWTNTESLYVGVVGTGDLIVSSSGVVAVDDLLSVGPRGTVQGNSTIAADVRNGGTISPGLPTGIVPADALGTLSVNGNYEQTPAGTLEIQLDSPSLFDKLDITGEAALAGALDVSFSNNGFSPAAGALFEILHADGGVFDGFTSISLPALVPGLVWNVIYSNFSVLLNVINIPPGDYNQNGFVDAADYVVWRNTLGQMGANVVADGNGNGTVDVADYDLWRANFGKTAAGLAATGSASSSVPEPAGTILLVLGALMAGLRRRLS